MTEKIERLSVVFHPMQGDESSLSVSGFASGIDGLRKAARKFNCRNLTIVSLSSNSPVQMIVEGAGPLSAFHAGLSQFIKSGEIPEAWDRDKIDSVLDFLSPVGKSVGRLGLVSDHKEIIISLEYKIDFKKSIEDDYFAVGTVDGMLDAVNIHGGKNTLTIYPHVGKTRITCEFDAAYLDQIKELIGSYIEIRGEMKYRWRDKYPYAGIVHEIGPVREDELPNFADLYGLAPNATKGVPAEEFIARIRSEWETSR